MARGIELLKQQFVPSSDSLPSVANDVMSLKPSLLIKLNSFSDSNEGRAKPQEQKYFAI